MCLSKLETVLTLAVVENIWLKVSASSFSHSWTNTSPLFHSCLVWEIAASFRLPFSRSNGEEGSVVKFKLISFLWGFWESLWNYNTSISDAPVRFDPFIQRSLGMRERWQKQPYPTLLKKRDLKCDRVWPSEHYKNPSENSTGYIV